MEQLLRAFAMRGRAVDDSLLELMMATLLTYSQQRMASVLAAHRQPSVTMAGDNPFLVISSGLLFWGR